MQLIRGYTPHGTFGTLIDQSGAQLCVTAERPWLNNRPFESCIPEGEYDLLPHRSPTFGNTLAIVGGTVSLYQSDEHTRYAVLFHAANLVEELHGCIAPGKRCGVIGQQWAVMQSRVAMQRIMDYTEATGDRSLIITHAVGVL